jgi:hypothetical protein
MSSSHHAMVGLVVGFVLVLGAGADPGDGCVSQQQAEMTEVYARTDWYSARLETEREWRGILRKRDAPIGPAARTALTYELATDDSTYSVYAANVEEVLAPFVDEPVLIRGKLVDLSAEGFGSELWIGFIGNAENREE